MYDEPNQPSDQQSRPIEIVENEWVTLDDGCRIALRIWRPVNATEQPVPAILEAHPYRKTDCSAPTDESRHRYIAEHGYACVRMDLRGSGDSDGILHDEYLPQEHADICEVIAWLTAQPWCSGSVGMYGISWGGFNSLQVAALRPEGLDAIISVCSTDDRFADDVHYQGGCVLGSEMLSWSSTMLAYSTRPPDPHVVGSRWRDMWLDRVDAVSPLVETWLRHQRRDEYWQHGSVVEDYSAIECPVYLVGGWEDGYRNALVRMAQDWPEGVTKAVIGPWGHMYPDTGVPGPAGGFVRDSIRWWDHWLKGIDTGLMDEARIHAWLPDPAPPSVNPVEQSGRWLAADSWAELTTAGTEWHVDSGGHLAEGPNARPERADTIRHASPLISAAHPGAWCASGRDGDHPADQRPEDGQSLTFTSASLEDGMELLGAPRLHVRLASDSPQANLVVRLCDVGPDGSSKLVCRGVLNLSHRSSHADPATMSPGEPEDVVVELNAGAHRFERGHRLRLALSGSLWPIVWPAPTTTTFEVAPGAVRLQLPGADLTREVDYAPLGSPELSPPLKVDYVGPPRAEGHRRSVEVARSGETLTVPRGYPVVVRFCDIDLEYDDVGQDRFEISGLDPWSAAAHASRSVTLEREGWSIQVDVEATMTCDADYFRLVHRLEAFEMGQLVATRDWRSSIPRDHQ